MDKKFIHETALLNVPFRLLTGCIKSSMSSSIPSIIPESCYIGPYCSVGCGVKLGNNVILDSYVSIEPNASIGNNTLLIYRCSIGAFSKIGNNCIIGGFIPENTVIGNYSKILGTLVHRHEDPAIDWDHHERPETPPIIDEGVFVGINALVIGGVRIHRKAYICAGAIVTNDVPEKHIVSRNGDIIYYKDWSGTLKLSDFFKD